MTDQLAQLIRLEAELHEVNEEFANAARPLGRLSEMDGEQRRQIADELRSRFARWESVAQEIAHVMGTGSANGQEAPKGNKVETR